MLFLTAFETVKIFLITFQSANHLNIKKTYDDITDSLKVCLKYQSNSLFCSKVEGRSIG